MSAVIPASLAKIEYMVAHAVGRIEHVEKYQNKFTTLLKTPAQDSYSHPSLIPLRSKGRLGSPGDEISVKFDIGGVPRAFKRVDKDTGEEVMVRTADAYFNVIE